MKRMILRVVLLAAVPAGLEVYNPGSVSTYVSSAVTGLRAAAGAL